MKWTRNRAQFTSIALQVSFGAVSYCCTRHVYLVFYKTRFYSSFSVTKSLPLIVLIRRFERAHEYWTVCFGHSWFEAETSLMGIERGSVTFERSEKVDEFHFSDYRHTLRGLLTRSISPYHMDLEVLKNLPQLDRWERGFVSDPLSTSTSYMPHSLETVIIFCSKRSSNKLKENNVVVFKLITFDIEACH